MLEARDLLRRIGRGPDAFVLSVDHFALRPGEITAILGPNGSGKTTLLRVLAGDPQAEGAGSVRIASGRVTLVAQRPLAFAGSVAHNASVGLLGQGIARAERDDRVGAALERFGIGGLARHDARTLSGGELRRLALARAFVIEPSVLLLDEPFDDLDAEGQRRLSLDLLRAVRETGVALAVVTHDLSRALLLADRIAVLAGGRIAQAGPRDEVLARPTTPAIARLVGMTNLAPGRVVAQGDGVVEIELDSGHVVAGAAMLPVGAQVWIGIRPEHLKLDVARGGGRAIGSARVETLLDDGLVTVVALALAGRSFTTHLLSGRGLAKHLRAGDAIDVGVVPEQVHVRMLDEPHGL
ncbi:MAG: ABC transporter ATP-binding protein [Deltaproteobacteria bacterium]|nr:ABC transporter ATP-binding protein [Deltaproteobacteria bacterium]